MEDRSTRLLIARFGCYLKPPEALREGAHVNGVVEQQEFKRLMQSKSLA